MRSHIRRYPQPAHTIYWDATNGLDTNTGAADHPRQTTAATNALVLNPGDRVLFARGQTWSGTALTPPSSGTPGRPITFADYGSGALPVIVAGAAAHAFSITTPSNRNYITVKNLSFSGGTADSCVKVGGIGILVDGCTVVSGGTFGIQGFGTADIVGRIIIRNCTVHNNAGSGIVMHAADTPADGNGPSNCLIELNTCYLNGTSTSGDHGIYCEYGSNNTIRDNACYDNKAGGIKGNSQHGTIIERNHCYGSEPNHVQNYGIIMDVQAGVTCIGNIVRNNVLEGNKNNLYWNTNLLSVNYYYHNTLVNGGTGANGSGYGLVMMGGAANQVFKNNVIRQDRAACGGSNACIYGATLTEVSANTFDYNELYYDDTAHFSEAGTGVLHTFAQWQALTGTPDAHSLSSDPVFVTVTTVSTTVNGASNSAQKVIAVASTVGFAVGNVTLVNEGGARDEIRQVASIQAGVSLTATFNLTNSHTAVQADVVAHRWVTDWHLQTSSPAKTAGTNLGVATDYDGYVRSATPSMGAYEFH
jgi:parallel beta-helix repeat protein